MIVEKSEPERRYKKMADKTLRDLPLGQSARVVGTGFHGSEKRRMLDLGIVGGTRVRALHKSPCGDPVADMIRGAVIAIRGDDAKNIYIGRR